MIASWLEYETASPARKHEIAVEWCSVGSGYKGDGSEREDAFWLYVKYCNSLPINSRYNKRSDEQKDHDEYIEEMSLGGKVYEL